MKGQVSSKAHNRCLRAFCIHSPVIDDTQCLHLDETQAEVMCVMLERRVEVGTMLAKWNELEQINISIMVHNNSCLM